MNFRIENSAVLFEHSNVAPQHFMRFLKKLNYPLIDEIESLLQAADRSVTWSAKAILDARESSATKYRFVVGYDRQFMRLLAKQHGYVCLQLLKIQQGCFGIRSSPADVAFLEKVLGIRACPIGCLMVTDIGRATPIRWCYYLEKVGISIIDSEWYECLVYKSFADCVASCVNHSALHTQAISFDTPEINAAKLETGISNWY